MRTKTEIGLGSENVVSVVCEDCNEIVAFDSYDRNSPDAFEAMTELYCSLFRCDAVINHVCRP